MKDHISVCIPTFRRNRMLERLLRNLALQESDGLFDFSVVIVDNDVSAPARETVMRLKDELELDFTYGVEPVQTIPAVRNHALRLAKGNYIAIIDDDEFPPQKWLATMYRAIKAFDVDGALGPVHPFFEQVPPEWLITGKFCERPVHRTGTLLNWTQTRTGNVLLKRDVFDNNNLYFDESFKTGGSDREFFKQAMQLGCRFIAVEEAPVYEIVPPERWTRNYYVRRALVNGYNAYKNSKGQLHGMTRLLVPMKSFIALIGYSIALPLSYLVGKHAVLRVMESSCHHLSRLCAMIGIELVAKRDF